MKLSEELQKVSQQILSVDPHTWWEPVRPSEVDPPMPTPDSTRFEPGLHMTLGEEGDSPVALAKQMATQFNSRVEQVASHLGMSKAELWRMILLTAVKLL